MLLMLVGNLRTGAEVVQHPRGVTHAPVRPCPILYLLISSFIFFLINNHVR